MNKQFEEIKDRECQQFGYSGELEIRTHQGTPHFKGRMSLAGERGEVSFNPDYQEKNLEKIVKGDPQELAVTAVIRHELNHRGGKDFKGCPRTLNLHAEHILEPVASALQRLGFPNIPVSEEQTLDAYLANLVEDIIDNTELGTRGDGIGMSICYQDNARSTKEKKFPPLFDAFIEMQERLYGGLRSRKLLRDHRSEKEEVKSAIDNIFERTRLASLQREITTRKGKKKKVLDRKQAANYLLDEKNWPSLSAIIVEELASLLDKNQLQNPQYRRMHFIPLAGQHDLDEEMKRPATKERLAVRRYERAKEKNVPFAPPSYMDSFEALDFVYQRLARELEIHTRPSAIVTGIPVVKYGQRAYDPEQDRLSEARVTLNVRGDLEFTVRPFEIVEPGEFTSSHPHPPRVKFVLLDTSDSMRTAMGESTSQVVMNPWAEKEKQWTNTSRYHYALLSWYGLIELERVQGTLKHEDISLTNYSSRTRSGKGLREAKREALSPQFGSTSLDLNQVKDLFDNADLIVSTSDGEIENWGAIRSAYIERAKQRSYVHIQMGNFRRDAKGNIAKKPQMCEDLERAGLHVYYEEGKNATKKVIDITRPYLTSRRMYRA